MNVPGQPGSFRNVRKRQPSRRIRQEEKRLLGQNGPDPSIGGDVFKCSNCPERMHPEKDWNPPGSR